MRYTDTKTEALDGEERPGKFQGLETKRLFLREMTWEDRPAICAILQDQETMYAYEHAFSDEEADGWMENQMGRYRKFGFGLWAVEKKETGEVIGQCGLTWQPVPEGIDASGRILEIGYLFQRSQWGKGYATEAAAACREYAFQVLKAPKVSSIIRENNYASRNVAERNGLKPVGTFVKHYYGMDMPHIAYVCFGDSGQCGT